MFVCQYQYFWSVRFTSGLFNIYVMLVRGWKGLGVGGEGVWGGGVWAGSLPVNRTDSIDNPWSAQHWNSFYRTLVLDWTRVRVSEEKKKKSWRWWSGPTGRWSQAGFVCWSVLVDCVLLRAASVGVEMSECNYVCVCVCQCPAQWGADSWWTDMHVGVCVTPRVWWMGWNSKAMDKSANKLANKWQPHNSGDGGWRGGGGIPRLLMHAHHQREPFV